MPIIPAPLLGVHISDGVLTWPWLALGFAVAIALMARSSTCLNDDEIPRVGLLTAVFFVASLIHVRVGPTSVHLLLNGLLGMILGGRAVLAVAVGLLLQASLLGHGGFSTLGVNVTVIAVPALLARPAYAYLLHALPAPSAFPIAALLAIAYWLHPVVALPLSIAVLLLRRCAWRWHLQVDFLAAYLVGTLCVMLTALLNAVVLVVAGIEDWRLLAGLMLAAYVPIALIEGFIIAAAVTYANRVKPELLPH